MCNYFTAFICIVICGSFIIPACILFFTAHCEPLKSTVCSHFGYSQTSFPNLWEDKSAEEANNSYYSVAERSVAAGCSPNVLFYVCSLLFPACEGDGVLKLPCTSYCIGNL